MVPSDIDELWRLEVDLELGSRSRFRGHTMSQSRYAQVLWADALFNRTIVRASDQHVLGLGSVYAGNLRCRRAWFFISTHRDARGTGAGVVGIGLIINEAFGQWPLRKLYADATEGAVKQYEHALAKVLTVEGILRSDCVIGEKLEDRLILSLDRDSWNEGYGSRLAAITRVPM